MMLDIQMMPNEAEQFDQMRNKFMEIMALPKSLAKLGDSLGIINIEEARNFRKNKIKELMPFVVKQVDQREVSSREDLELVTRATLGAIMFAGGTSVPDLLYKASTQ